MGAELPEEVGGAELWEALEGGAELAGLAVFIIRIAPAPQTIVYTSRRGTELVGRSAEQLAGAEPWSFFRREDRPAIEGISHRPAGAQPTTLEVQVERPDGRRVPVQLTTTRIVTPRATLGVGYIRDLTSERATKAALAKSEARFQFLLDQAPDAIAVIQHGTIVFVNPAARAFDASELLDTAHGHLETKSVPIEWDGAPAVLTFTRDISERKAIEAKLVEAERLAAVGKLAAEVAHEINNPLTYVQLTAHRLERTLTANLPAEIATTVRDQLSDIRHGIARIASITAGLRAFARADETAAPVEPEPPAPEPAPAPAESRRRVLVIDDEPLVRGVLAKLLADSHAVTPCASGAEGLALLATTRFDVIICDVMMPMMNGREVYRRIAAQFPGLERRVVFISGGTFAPDMEEFLEALPNAKIAKPFRLDEVLAIVEQIANSQ